jgi:hypothetical protein
VIRIVEPQTAHDPDVLARDRGEQRLHGEHARAELRVRVERGRAEDLARPDLFVRVRGAADVERGVDGLAEVYLRGLDGDEADQARPRLGRMRGRAQRGGHKLTVLIGGMAGCERRGITASAPGESYRCTTSAPSLSLHEETQKDGSKAGRHAKPKEMI